MSQLTIDLALDNYRSTLSQAYNGGSGSIYVNNVPNVSFPTGKKVLLTVNPEKTNMQVVELDGRDSVAKTLNCTGATVKRGEGANYSATDHSIGSEVKISIPYDARDDIKTAVNTKVNSDGDSIITDGNLTFAGSASKYGVAVKELTTAQIAALSSPPNGSAVVDSTLGAFQVKIGGSFQSMGAGATTPNASTTVAGKVEKATSGEVTAGTSTGGTGAELFVGPAELKVVTDSLLSTLYFGDGADGDVTISSGTTTLTRDMYYNNLTITSPGILDPAGYRVFVKGTIAGTGTINRNGNNGGNGSNGVGGTGGAALSQGSLNAEIAGVNGAAGGNSVGTAGTAGTASTTSLTNINGVAGGGGGNGNSGAGGAGGAAGASTRGTLYNKLFPLHLVHPATSQVLYSYKGGATSGSGGAGSGDNAGHHNGGSGGGSGGNGGVIRIFAYTRNFTGIVTATGGTGGNGSNAYVVVGGGVAAGGGGGGGGGNGGLLFRCYKTLVADCTKTLTGGAGGAAGTGISGGGTGTAGTAGNAGETITITV